MRDWLKRHRKSIRNIILLIVAAGLLYWLVLSAPIHRLILQNQLTQSTANWQTGGITHYRIVFDTAIPLLLVKTRFSMMVWNGQIEDVQSQGMVGMGDQNYIPVTGDQIKLYNLSTYTVEGMYQFASSAPNDSNEWHTFDFDPQYHYINRGDGGCYGAIGDCGFYYRVIEFEPLP